MTTLFILCIFSAALASALIAYRSCVLSRVSEIIPNKLYISNYATSIDIKKVQHFDRIICLNERKKTLDTLEKYRSYNITHIHYTIKDTQYTRIEHLFDSVYKDIQSPGKVLVHCTAGQSRAPTVVIMYLMRKYRMSYRAAYMYVYKIRPINPNKYFRKALLKEYVDLLHNGKIYPHT